ncbi:OmpA family protein [Neobacillus sp. 114]|uniref:OmpA family protein n=1 Tax=Neobacillus sp. 114 TaxID=3048535 RepID=UPI0024C2D640|nr:OmpA family protein [Neobacillus sp. 114]
MRKLRNKFHEEHEEEIPEAWLLPYADILTLLLALFIVLYAAGIIDQSKYNAIMDSFKVELTGKPIKEDAGPSPTKPNKPSDQAAHAAEGNSKEEEAKQLDQLKQQLENYIADNHLQDVITLSDTERGVEVTLKDVILFDQGKANLKEISFQTLNMLVGLIKTVPNAISIEGHTDNVPISNAEYKSNWELSSARSVSVLHYFSTNGISQDRMQFTGYGEFKPLFPNDSDQSRQSNRRVNIVILRAAQ